MAFQRFDMIARPALFGPATQCLVRRFQEFGRLLGEYGCDLGIVIRCFRRFFCDFHNLFYNFRPCCLFLV